MDGQTDELMQEVAPPGIGLTEQEGFSQPGPMPPPDQIDALYHSTSGADVSQWERTLHQIIPAIVSIRFIAVRNFGPVIAEGILNHSKEEIKLTPIYRDPGMGLGFV
ncbi:hypothetical protein HDV00_002739 [Rhizophlyctis rosea]|nr:hypothetical protein HDV00_002739 [Rhizophlyctis rosea]